MDHFGLAGKKVLVTGASSGIGRATAVLISRLGGCVILNGRDTGRLYQTLAMLDGAGHYVMPYDLTNLDGIHKYIAQCIQIDQRAFDGLVFAAGVVSGVPIRAENLEQLHHTMASNFYAYFTLLKEFTSKRVMHNNGAIVAVSSRAAMHPDKSQVSYASSKAALEAASGVASQELVKRKIRVNTVRPEMVDTPLSEFFFRTATKEQLQEYYPLGILTAEDVANTIVFLLSDMSSKITGQNIYLSAGNDGHPIHFLLN